MLPKVYRLHRSSDIVSVVRTGKKIITPYVIIHSRKALAGATYTRVACVVGKKVSPSAVIRHRYQRWLRVVAEKHLLSFGGVCDMVWVGRSSLLQVKRLADLTSSLKPYIKNN